MTDASGTRPTTDRTVDRTVPLSRTTTCACGAGLVQSGYEEPFTARVIWFPTACEACRGVKAKAQDDLAAGRQAMRRARAVTRLVVPPLYADATLASFRLHGSAVAKATQARCLQLARRYQAAWPAVDHLLVFRGAPGTGKGHVAWALAQAIATEYTAAVRVVKCADMVRALRASWRDDTAESEAKVLAGLRDVDLLVIDEVSRHAFYGQQIHQHLYDVIDHRVEYRRPTILTTNEDDAGLGEILRPALLDRLNGDGGLWEFGQESWRSRPRGDTAESAADGDPEAAA